MHSVVNWNKDGIQGVRKLSKKNLGEYVGYSYDIDGLNRCLSEGENTLSFGIQILTNELINRLEQTEFETYVLKQQMKRLNGNPNLEAPSRSRPEPLPLPKKPPRPSKLVPII
jgi:hypothetical protein